MRAINLTSELVFGKRALDKACYVGPGYALDYREFDRAVRRQAAQMLRERVAPGDRVVIALDDGPNLAVIFFAALAVGALPAALNSRLDGASLRQILADCEPVALYGEPAQAAAIRDAVHGMAASPRVFLPEFDWFRSLLASRDADDHWDAAVAIDPQAPALIQYTSGTTGRPKGVMHSSRGVLECCAAFTGQLGLGADDILYSVPKIFFGYGMGNSLFFPLYLGATAVLDPAWPTAPLVQANLRQFAPTVLFAVPTMYRMLLDAELPSRQCSLRLAFSAGAPLPEITASRWRARFGFDLHDGIGSTELCHVFATSYPDALRTGSLGHMLPDCEARIVGEHGRDTEPGEVGVLLIRAPFMAVGYWRRSPQEASGFVDGWYRTGDLFSRDRDGFLYFHGREDDRFKVYGRWVVPIEIEVLIGKHAPALGACFVVPGRDAAGEDRPVLCVHGRPDEHEVNRVIELLKREVDSHSVPATVLLLDDLPLTPNGKPNRRAIAQLADLALRRAQPVEDSVLC